MILFEYIYILNILLISLILIYFFLSYYSAYYIYIFFSIRQKAFRCLNIFSLIKNMELHICKWHIRGVNERDHAEVECGERLSN